jgi:peptide/nickel transport system ATP-binding protein
MSSTPPDSDRPREERERRDRIAAPHAPGSLDDRRTAEGFEIQDLAVAYAGVSGVTPVVGGVSLRARPGRITGVAGESGSGKTTAVLSAIAYLPPGARRLGGAVRLHGQSILDLEPVVLRRLWASEISYVAQDAGAALNPARRIGSQLEEILTCDRGLTRDAARCRATELLGAVRMPDPSGARRRYPHEFSGGQLQRIAIAMALAPEPRLIIFDEPTTGLDVTTAAEVIAMLSELIRERQLAAIYISHDLALLAAIADDLVVFYAGEVVESGPTPDVIAGPRHPYTRALLDALPSVRRALRPQGIPGFPPGRVVVDHCGFASRCSYVEARCRGEHPALVAVQPGRLVRCVRARELGPLPSGAASILQPAQERQGGPLLEVAGLVCEYGHGAGRVVAVDGVSLEVREREVVALVGESGSGKSTIGRAITGLLVPRAGTLRWRGEALPASERRTPAQHREIQIIFQNPDSSLNPRHTVGQLIGRAVALFREDVPPKARGDLIADALREVQLDPALMSRYPHQLSGGQKQRVAMARAFVARPRLVVCDEIISGQDVSVQATILELVRTMQREHETALLFISHDLAAVRSIAQYVYVLQGGRVQEHAATERLFATPAAAYTRRLLAAVLEPEASRGDGETRTHGSD